MTLRRHTDLHGVRRSDIWRLSLCPDARSRCNRLPGCTGTRCGQSSRPVTNQSIILRCNTIGRQRTNVHSTSDAIRRHDVIATNTCCSTSIAMSMNMSCSSLMLVSSLMMSLWRASMSFSDCFAWLVSVKIWQQPRVTCSTTTTRHVPTNNHVPLTIQVC